MYEKDQIDSKYSFMSIVEWTLTEDDKSWKFLFWMEQIWSSALLSHLYSTDFIKSDCPGMEPFSDCLYNCSLLSWGESYLSPVRIVNGVSIGSDNGLSPIRRQGVILTSAGLLSIGSLGSNLSEFSNFSISHQRFSSLYLCSYIMCTQCNDLNCVSTMFTSVSQALGQS